MGLPAFKLTKIQSPIAQWAYLRERVEALAPLVSSIDTSIITPLKSAADEVEWADRLDELLPIWMGMRLAFARAIATHVDEVMLEEMTEAAQEIPLPGLSQTAEGALSYALDILVWLTEQTFAAARRRRLPNLEQMEEMLEEIAAIELCWFTIALEPSPRADVAEAAAWEAYSRVRPLGLGISYAGFDMESFPGEAPQEAALRAAAMLRRVASGWTDDEREGFEAGLFKRDGALP